MFDDRFGVVVYLPTTLEVAGLIHENFKHLCMNVSVCIGSGCFLCIIYVSECAFVSVCTDLLSAAVEACAAAVREASVALSGEALVERSQALLVCRASLALQSRHEVIALSVHSPQPARRRHVTLAGLCSPYAHIALCPFSLDVAHVVFAFRAL
jgi:hypothetical protein